MARERYGERLFSQGDRRELRRLTDLAGVFDPATRALVERINPQVGWRCVDVGAGAGTIATHLADCTGASGEVLAVDRDVRLLDRSGDLRVTAVEADVTDPAFDPGRFDLVHCRFVLTHLPERDEVLARLASWLKPGGWLVVSDPAELGIAGSPADAYRETSLALLDAVAETLGTDIDLGRRHPAALRALGLVEVGSAIELLPLTGGSLLAEVWGQTIEAARGIVVATGRVDGPTVDAALAYLDDPATWDLCIGMVSSWGRRAVEEPAAGMPAAAV